MKLTTRIVETQRLLDIARNDLDDAKDAYRDQSVVCELAREAWLDETYKQWQREQQKLSDIGNRVSALGSTVRWLSEELRMLEEERV